VNLAIDATVPTLLDGDLQIPEENFGTQKKGKGRDLRPLFLYARNEQRVQIVVES
jgi:hypothetical protein